MSAFVFELSRAKGLAPSPLHERVSDESRFFRQVGYMYAICARRMLSFFA